MVSRATQARPQRAGINPAPTVKAPLKAREGIEFNWGIFWVNPLCLHQL